MANPFDLRTIVLARHAQHIVLIHFPIALFITGVLFDVLSRVRRSAQLAAAAYVNLAAAAVTILPTVATGFLAWQFVLEGRTIKGLLLWHLMAASLAALLVIGCWVLHWRARRNGAPGRPGVRLALEVLAVVALVLTAHLGGFLTGVNR